MSMRVERSSLDQVKARFATNKKKAEEKQKSYDFDQRITDLKEEASLNIYILDRKDARNTHALLTFLFSYFVPLLLTVFVFN